MWLLHLLTRPSVLSWLGREQAKAYEVCLEVLMMLTTIFSSEKQYPYLSQTLERFRALTDTLITAVPTFLSP